MRVLIIGVTGSAGSAFHRLFAPDGRFETWGTIRDGSARRFFPERDHARLLSGVDVGDHGALVAALDRVRPDVVINAVGVIKQLAASNDPLKVLPINSLLPHQLAALCGLAGARLVHISTDCVFSGRAGNYKESDLSDAEDLYGKSKYIGEVHDRANAITLRTSGIGHELGSSLGLVEWFLAQSESVKGYAKAIYTGLPWNELGVVIRDRVIPNKNLKGMYQVSSDAISKLDLLKLVAKVYGKKIDIIPDDTVRIDRSLDSTRFRKETGWVPAAWPELVASMHASRPTVTGKSSV